MTEQRPGPLAGIRVLDLGHAGVGPYAAGLLAQMGADVIKCEPPWGDIINRSGGRDPSQARPADLYIFANVSKRGISIDVKDEAQRHRFLDLVRTADVYMDNLRADAADRMGIGYEILRAVNPRLVFANCSGFGAEGPLREMGSFEQYSDAFAGLPSVTGPAGGSGRRLPGLRVDPFSALCLVNMVLAALVHRARTGEGQKIVGSQFQSALQLASVRAIEPLNFGIAPERFGTGHPHIVPSRVYPTADGHLAVTAETETQWRSLCLALGQPEMIFDPVMSSNAERIANRGVVDERLAELFRAEPTATWVARLQARRVPAGRLLTPPEHVDDPHVAATEMLPMVGSHWGPVRMPLVPIRFGDTPRRVAPGPFRGEHTHEVLEAVSTSAVDG